MTGTSFDGDELLDQIAMLFLAGHETSASALAWSLYLMAEAPEVQARVQAEADAVLGDDQPAFEHMKRLGFTRDVFREAMRLYPPVAFLARDCPAGDRLGKRDIPPGSVVMVSPWLSHRQAERWTEPHAFRPGPVRLSRGQGGHGGRLFPLQRRAARVPRRAFALQEAVLVLAMLSRRLRFEADPAWTPVPVARLTLRSANGVQLRVFRRGGG